MIRMPNPDDMYFEAHVFCCTNEREDGHPRGSCKARGGQALRDYMKTRAKELGLAGRVRVNSAGCLDRCELGPCLVIYPEGIWYTYRTEADVDEILERHIGKGETVERLVLAKDQTDPSPVEVPASETGLLDLKVAGIVDLAPGIRQFELVSPDGRDLPAFEAGAHIDIQVGDGGSRSYSLSNDPADRGRYVIAVKCEDAGAGGSLWLHTSVAVGDHLPVRPPANDFPLNRAATKTILIAGGIGITPLLSMARVLDRSGADYTLHYCARDPEGAAFLDEIQQRFGAHTVLHFDGGNPGDGIDLGAVLANPAPGTHVYICGPAGLMAAAQDKAAACGWAEDAVHVEYFAAPDAGGVEATFDVILKKSGQRFTVPVGTSILDVLRDNGIQADSSCEGGVCGTCRVRLLDGAADHRDMVLSDDEKAANADIMICVSRAAAGSVLVLDI